MKKELALLPLFNQFIKDSKSGKRLKKNGEKITPGSINNYIAVYKNLEWFESDTGFKLRFCCMSKLNTRELVSEKNYWKNFYLKFTSYLYKKGCHDNYVGSINIKIIRVFFNYLKNDKNFNTQDIQKTFYVRKEEVEVLALNPDQLKLLIYNKDLDEKLSDNQKTVKDIFIFGCCTGLRFSDIHALTNQNFELLSDQWYLKIRTKKTKTFCKIKLPDYAVDILIKYNKKKNVKEPLFKKFSLDFFNTSLRIIGEKADFTSTIQISREKLGVCSRKEHVRFCDKMSSHMMRRTAITTLLILGMPEHLVRKISGHGTDSKSFYRYVDYAQSYVDTEIDKVHLKLKEF